MEKRSPARQALPIILVVYLAVSAVLIFFAIERESRSLLSNRGDFSFFYSAAKLVLSADRGTLYERGSDYYNPPLLALLIAPLTALSGDLARDVLAGLCVAAAAGTALLGRAWTGRWPAVALSALAIASFWPTYASLRFGHPSLLLALVAGLALLMTARAKRGPAGLLVALLALKPSFLPALAGLTLWRGDRRAIAALLIGGFLLILLPFFYVSSDAILEYVRLVSSSRDDAFRLAGRSTAGALWMLNWNGFVGRLLLEDPRPLLVFPFYLVTALAMVKVWVRNDLYESWLAAGVTTALVTPHFLYYDLVIVLPAALALAFVRPSPLLLALLLVAHLAVNLSIFQIQTGPTARVDNDFALIVAAPALLALLAYLAYRPQLDALVERYRRRADVATAAAAA